MPRAVLPIVAVLLVVPIALAEAPAALHGLAPLSDDRRVPQKLLPPGAFDPDSGPSDVIFPAQHARSRMYISRRPRRGSVVKPRQNVAGT